MPSAGWHGGCRRRIGADPVRIAVLGDVHGNLAALEAVLCDLRAASPDAVVNLGDLVSGPFDPAGAAAAQMALDAQGGTHTIAGNHERHVLEGGEGASDAYARGRLSAAQLRWMADLPGTLTLLEGRVFACHGSPAGGDLEYLLEDVGGGRTRLDRIEAIRPRLAGIGAAELVLCAHTHVPRAVRVDGVLVVNPGSVGMPCYRDVEPVPHAMEAGAPEARYALVEHGAGGWRVELRAVPYDTEVSALQAERAGRPDLAHAARTGWLPPV